MGKHKIKRRALRFIVLFVMMLMFAIIEDVLAATVSGAQFIIETLPLIVVIATVFTFITEYVEERMEPGIQPLEGMLNNIGKRRK